MNRYQPRIPTASALGVCQDTDASTVTYRKLPFDFKGYIQAMIGQNVDLPGWLLELLVAIAK